MFPTQTKLPRIAFAAIFWGLTSGSGSAGSMIQVFHHLCYLETESEVSCGSADFDLITEISDAVCEPGCGFGRVATGEVFGAEVLVVSAVTQHVVDRRQDRRGHRDGRLLGAAACFETQALSL